MSDNTYKKMMKKIEVPSQLKEKTLDAIKEAQMNKSLSRPIYKTTGASLLAVAVFFIIVGISFYYSLSRDMIFKTKIGAEHLTFVELNNGYLNFADSNPMEDIHPNLGLINPFQKKWMLQEYEEYVGKKLELTYLPPDFKQSSSEITAKYLADGTLESVTGVFKYENSEKSYIKLTVSDLPVSPPLAVSEDTISEVNGIEMNLMYNQSKDMYCAFFEDSSQYYLLSSQTLEQKEFIKILYYFLK